MRALRSTQKMWNSNLHYKLLHQGAGKGSQVSSQRMESSQEETENLEPWSRIFDEAEKRHETQLNALVNEYEVERRFRKCGPSEIRERSSSCLQKRAKKSTLGESTVDACNEKRSHLQKSDGNSKRA